MEGWCVQGPSGQTSINPPATLHSVTVRLKHFPEKYKKVQDKEETENNTAKHLKLPDDTWCVKTN